MLEVEGRESVVGKEDNDVSDRVSGGPLTRFGSPCG